MILTYVVLQEGESFESLLKRFNKRVQQEGILSAARKHEHFEPPSLKRKKKAATKLRKSLRNSG
ncbi:30S ribosomal protein S21 [bacterium HR23]|nr:30S ribosomal protein S21 [bacterium HR23]